MKYLSMCAGLLFTVFQSWGQEKLADTIHPNAGKKVFLLAQSYMPAQQIHIFVNPTSRNLSPRYELTETDTGKLYTPEWIFEKKDLKRFNHTTTKNNRL